MQFLTSNKMADIVPNFFEQLDKKISQIEDKGSMIDLAKGNPDQPTPEFIIESLKKAVDLKTNHGYTPFNGKQNFLDAIARYYQRIYNIEIETKSEILTFNGSVIGISAIPQVILNPGDYVITTDPCYPEYYTAVSLAGGKLYQLPLTRQNHYLPDLSKIPHEIVKQAKILLLNYPNNPTGATATEEFFKQAIEFGKKNKILVVNDFAYAAIAYDQRPVSLLQIEGAKDYAVELNTLSKTYDMAGWRVGYVLGNESVVTALKKYHSHVYSTIFGAIQDAAVAGLDSDQEAVNHIRDTYQKRRDVLVAGLRNLGWDVEEPQGTFFVWIKTPAEYGGQKFAELILKQANVVVAPGIGFGPSGKNYIRLSLTHDEKILKEVIKRFSVLEY
ncbi:aminotransferase class I/II-fold pyridoxal phosphate-dependent enzyme [Lactobacillus sp. UCMA15818]|uniref:aminotransferase class I/II-fold pyridoxal phosphate-dependent enzyme n=1 Tax=Lactobacillus sp. UCMA15818 TaxID=2583394 RepID=UPI0025B11430|nr:aminotransferase class I/II-fold pyridoxal phosphate-dependent enzyme [Lactobacillus sp. UCMA15818]MDN2453370.1 aminotransferase class I/II-fold pyridoxal phosphate-dependent enzyme [Lactobacillus sp. UCMA15818]